MDVTLAHGAGNDFVVIADLEDRLDLTPGLVRALTDRRRGLGADGVLRIGAPHGDADVFMDYRNADGSIVEMCGNGVRVVAKHVVDHGLVAAGHDVVRVGTRAGVKPVEVVRGADGRVAWARVDMGAPVFTPAEVPFEADDPDAPTHVVEVDGQRVELAVVSMGNPHGVLVAADVASAPVRTLGPRLETHARFPAKANIGFVQPLDETTIRLRVWERGVGETAACGTGACAAVVSLQRLGHLDPGTEVRVELPGGTLHVTHRGGTVILAGPAVEVLHGRVDDAWLAAARDGGPPGVPLATLDDGPGEPVHAARGTSEDDGATS